jgi:glycine dehydrogenase subunit 2
MSVDTHFYPLGSCTMKHNPKRNERVAGLAGFSQVHPYQPDETLQGLLQLLFELQEMLAEISGLPAVSLQPAAGAQGEMTALMVANAHFRHLGEHRPRVLTPDTSHGTNPASARIAGFESSTIRSTPAGYVDLDHLRGNLDHEVAVFMITNPNTLGLFENQVAQIADLVHGAGALIYLDGANMNAILGISRPGDFGADMMHYNPHKTFSGPHGGGGPGAGPICVSQRLAPYLPAPVVVRDGGTYRLDYDRPLSIGRVRTYVGNIGVLVRAYAYILSHGPDGLRRVSENAVLNANYLLHRVQPFLPVPHGDRCMHEFVASASQLKKDKHLTAMDLAKRLLDYGFHAPTVYFPLTAPEAVMVEPTETESRETLDAFAAAVEKIVAEPSEVWSRAPHSAPVSRPDEVAAARRPVLKWTPGESAAP